MLLLKTTTTTSDFVDSSFSKMKKHHHDDGEIDLEMGHGKNGMGTERTMTERSGDQDDDGSSPKEIV